jgi:hypothetical protein
MVHGEHMSTSSKTPWSLYETLKDHPALVIAGVSMLGYTCYFLYEVGYLSFFGLPIFMIQLDIFRAILVTTCTLPITVLVMLGIWSMFNVPAMKMPRGFSLSYVCCVGLLLVSFVPLRLGYSSAQGQSDFAVTRFASSTKRYAVVRAYSDEVLAIELKIATSSAPFIDRYSNTFILFVPDMTAETVNSMSIITRNDGTFWGSIRGMH